MFKDYKENMDAFYNKVKNRDSIRLETQKYIDNYEELVCKLEKESQRDIQHVTAIWINNKKYSYGIFYEQGLGNLLFWHFNEQCYWERLGIYRNIAVLWTSEKKGEIYKDTLGTRIYYYLCLN